MSQRFAFVTFVFVSWLSAFGVLPASAQIMVPQGASFAVNVHTAGSQHDPRVDCNGDGRCVVVWTSIGQDGSGAGAFARIYDEDGSAVSVDLQVATTTEGDQHAPDVCVHDDGGFVVAWDGTAIGAADGVYFRRFEPAGSPVGEEVSASSSGDGYLPSVGCAGDGSFVMAWGENSEVRVRPFGIDGQPVDESVAHETANVRRIPGGLDVAPDGSFIVVWDDEVAHPNLRWSRRVRARRFDAGGTATGPAIIVQEPGPIPHPYEGFSFVYGSDVVSGSDGGFMVIWTSVGEQCNVYVADDCLSDYGTVWLRRYDAAGTPSFVRILASDSSKREGQHGGGVAAAGNGYLAVCDRATDDEPYPFTARILARPFTLEGASSDDGNLTDSLSGMRRTPAVAGAANDTYLVPWVDETLDGDSFGIFARYVCVDVDEDGLCGTADPCPADAADDGDADGSCGDVDNCPLHANSDQADGDLDGAGDVCDACAGASDLGDDDEDGIPDACDLCENTDGQGNFDDRSRLSLSGLDDGVGGNDSLKFAGTLAGQAVASADSHGARIRITSASGALLVDAVLPPGEYAGGGTAGWHRKHSDWTYLDRTGSPVAGIVKVSFKERGEDRFAVKILGRKSTYAIAAEDSPVRLHFEIGDVPAQEGTCAATKYFSGDCRSDQMRGQLTCS